MDIETAKTAIAYTGIVLAAFTAAHVFLWLIIWANDTVRLKIARHRGLGRIFRLLFLHKAETLRKHEQEIHDFLDSLELQDRESCNK